jgi:methionyl aminopeptidase
MPSYTLKTEQEIELIRENGKMLSQILREVAAAVRPGISTLDLNAIAERRIAEAGGIPSFKGYGDDVPFPTGLITSVNDAVVHGIPSKHEFLQEGDIVSLDIGMEYKKLFTDMAITVGVGQISDEASELIRVTKKALAVAIAAARVGNTIGDIGAAVQGIIEPAGFSVVRDLVGHGVGHAVHEDPQVPNYGKAGTGLKLVAGMVLAIEPMVTVGSHKLYIDDDQWTFRTQDESLAAHFEHTVAITDKGPRIFMLSCGTITI